MSLWFNSSPIGERPKIPDDCHSSYAALIRRCWHGDPDTRPSLREAKQELDTFIEDYRTMTPI